MYATPEGTRDVKEHITQVIKFNSSGSLLRQCSTNPWLSYITACQLGLRGAESQ